MKMTTSAIREHMRRYDGLCSTCDAVTREGGVEPDAEEYACPVCEGASVCGIEQAVVSGLIEVEPEVHKASKPKPLKIEDVQYVRVESIDSEEACDALVERIYDALEAQDLSTVSVLEALMIVSAQICCTSNIRPESYVDNFNKAYAYFRQYKES